MYEVIDIDMSLKKALRGEIMTDDEVRAVIALRKTTLVEVYSQRGYTLGYTLGDLVQAMHDCDTIARARFGNQAWAEMLPLPSEARGSESLGASI